MAQDPVTTPFDLTLKQCLIIILALGILIHWFALPEITDISKKSKTGIPHEDMLLPSDIAIFNKEMGTHTYTLTIEYQNYQRTQFQLFPRNCVSRIILNGFPVAYPLDKRCNFTEGIPLEFKRLRPGVNTLTIITDGPGIAFGPTIFNKGNWQLADFLGILLISATCIALVLYMEQLTGERITGYIMAAGLVLYLYVLSETTFMWKKYDMPDHLEYISFIANHLRWPKTYIGFLTYHPPLYYTLQAIMMRFANWLGSFDVISVLRIGNVMYFMAFLTFAVLTLRRLIRNKCAYYIAVLFLIFYPGGVTTASRMDSNLLFYTWFGGFLYFLTCWVQNYRHRDLALSLAMCGLAMATRTNALLLLPLLGLAALYQWHKYGLKNVLSCLKHRTLWYGIAILLLGTAINFGRPAYDNLFNNRDQSYLVANADYLASVARGLRIINEWASYLSFSIKDYFYPPYSNAWGPHGGRYYFWISVIKTSMYGEFDYPNKPIAYYLNGFLLALVLYVIASMLMNWRQLKHQPEWLMFMLTLFIPVAGLAANRIINPIACSQDFRYIYPAVVALCGLVGFSIEQHLMQRRKLIAALGIAGVVIFSSLSALFFLKMF